MLLTLSNDMINLILSFCDQDTINTLQYVNHYFYFKTKAFRKRTIELCWFDSEEKYSRCAIRLEKKFEVTNLDELSNLIINSLEYSDLHKSILDWDRIIKLLPNKFQYIRKIYDHQDDTKWRYYSIPKKIIVYIYNEIYKPIDIIRLIQKSSWKNTNNEMVYFLHERNKFFNLNPYWDYVEFYKNQSYNKIYY